MSFEAKRLRVQLPCGTHTAREVDVGGGGCPFPTDVCEGGTCWFETPPVCRFPTRLCEWPTLVGCAQFGTWCHYGSITCLHGTCLHGTCPFDTCGFVSPTCRWASDPCGPRSAIGCGPGTDIAVDPGKILVDPEHLPVLRERLEAQLKEIEKAEEELKKHREANE
jgi:hypothetical protein